MPMYDYTCRANACGYSFETQRSMTDADSAACPECGSPCDRKRVNRLRVRRARPARLPDAASVIPSMAEAANTVATIDQCRFIGRAKRTGVRITDGSQVSVYESEFRGVRPAIYGENSDIETSENIIT